MRKRQEKEPATISVNFLFLLCLSKVKYHWLKSAKGEKTVNSLCFDEIPTESVICRAFSKMSTVRQYDFSRRV